MKKILMTIGMGLVSMAVTVGAWTVPDETLHYSVNFKWGLIDANAGIATLTTENMPGTGQFKATLTGKSVDLMGHYYAVGDTMVGTVMAETMQPVYTQHLSREAGMFSIETVTYDTSGNSSLGKIVKELPDGKVVRSRVSHYGGGLTLDLLAVFYYIRQIEYEKMTPGECVKVNIFSGKNPETLTVTYDGTRVISFDGTDRQVYDISLTFSAEDGGHVNTDRMNVAVSSDEDRIPLLINGSLKIGHLICRYVGDLTD